MKPHIKLIITIGSIALGLLATSCSKVGFDDADSEDVVMGLSFGGDIVDVIEQEMTKADASMSDLIYIAVYKGTDKYAWGFFDSLEKIDNLCLKAGSKYSVRCSVYKNGKNLIYYDKSKKGYWFSPWHSYTREDSYYIPVTTYFTYNKTYVSPYSKTYVSPLSDFIYLDQYTRRWCAKMDRFEGEVNDIVPTVRGKIEIPLKRVSFGLKVNITGIEDGSVSVTVKNSAVTLFSKTDLTSEYSSSGEIFSMQHVSDAYTNAHLDYQEPVTMSVTWTRGNGIVQNLGTKTIYMKRNCMNVINLKLSTNDIDVDVDVDPEEGDMDDEDEDLSS